MYISKRPIKRIIINNIVNKENKQVDNMVNIDTQVTEEVDIKDSVIEVQPMDSNDGIGFTDDKKNKRSSKGSKKSKISDDVVK